MTLPPPPLSVMHPLPSCVTSPGHQCQICVCVSKTNVCCTRACPKAAPAPARPRRRRRGAGQALGAEWGEWAAIDREGVGNSSSSSGRGRGMEGRRWFAPSLSRLASSRPQRDRAAWRVSCRGKGEGGVPGEGELAAPPASAPSALAGRGAALA